MSIPSGALDLTRVWASLADVSSYAGASVTDEQLVIAQVLIEGLINRVWRESDADTGDIYWLKRAVAWQARHVATHPELMTLGPLISLTQDGMSASWDSETNGSPIRYISPVSLSLLNNMRNGANAAVRVNSGYQRTWPRRMRNKHGRHGQWRSI